ncbi:hypothetical protein [Streptomyces sp. NPDC054975]
MLTESLAMLAAAGGTAVVTAAGQDAWEGFRRQLARWFGRGDAERERSELERLDQTAQDLEAASSEQAERVRIRQEASWQARIEGLLESLGAEEREEAAAALRSLLSQAGHSGPQVSAGAGGTAVGGDIAITADAGSIAAWTIEGGAQTGGPPPQNPSSGEGPRSVHPPTPDPPQG